MRTLMKVLISLLSAILTLNFSSVYINCGCISAYAEEQSINVDGKVYEFDEKNSYNISSADQSETVSEGAKTYGKFSVSGDVASISDRDGIPVYAVGNGTLTLSYQYDDSLLNAEEDQLHLVSDDSKKINDITLEDNILKGAIIIQTSRDGKKWFAVPDQTKTDVFKDIPVQESPLYETTDVQLVNGCYYKVIIAYKTGIRVQTGQIFPPRLEKYDYQRHAEVYEFYAYNQAAKEISVPSSENRRNLGEKVRTAKFEGYSGEKGIDNKDPHFGWDIGQFYVGGYTDYETDSDGNPLFLKNNGDQVSLWFELKQDIDRCFNNPSIKIAADAKGSDSYFEVPGGVNETMDFGRGALIIRKINPDNTKSPAQIYTNYLEASASANAITKVNLFEEGDYEVALDYAVKFDKTKILNKSILPELAHYKIFFKFSVRNGNSMVFLFDQATGSELSSGAVTANGFRLDFANSQYLKVNVKRETLKDGFDGLAEDTRFNSSATNGDVFTDEGVYTITVNNQYNNATTVKKIYVGNDNILKAYMKTGMSISEIKDQIALGATIADDGTINEPKEESETAVTEKPDAAEETDTLQADAIADTQPAEMSESDDNAPAEGTAEAEAVHQVSAAKEKSGINPILLIALAACAAGAAVFALKNRKNNGKAD